MKAPVKEIRASLVVGDDDEITNTDDLISYTIDTGSVAVGKTVLRQIKGEYLGERVLVGQSVEVKLGVRLASGDFEDVSLGSFIITQGETIKDRGVTSFTGYDSMIYSIIAYQSASLTYPTDVSGLYSQIATGLGLDIATDDIPLGDLEIESDLYENINGFAYRDAFEEIAVLGGAVAMINKDGQLDLRNIKTPDNTPEELSYADLKTLLLKDKYGEVNSLVLGREPQQDNVVTKDDDSIEENGLTEVKIINNQIIDKRREDVADEIFSYFQHTEYYPFEATTIGLGYFEIGDALKIEDSEGTIRDVRVMGISMTVDGSIQEKIWSDEPSKTETNYARAGGLDRRIKNTELYVDKQNQIIQGIVSDMYDEDGIVNTNYTTLTQTIDQIEASIQSSGGNNLLKNSVFFQFDDSRVPTLWDVAGTGTMMIEASSEAISYGSLSGNNITLKGETVSQTVDVVLDTSETPENEKTYYTLSTKIKKGYIGTAKIRIYNDEESHEVEIPNGEQALYKEIEIKALLPLADTYTVELSGSSDSDATFTDTMLNVGKYKSQWTQANGEILNTRVQINEDGIIVKSSVYLGDYTAITPLEFSGYSSNGTSTERVFTLNKDRTEVKRLRATDEISMLPIKIVPITDGSVLGWVFVAQGEDD